MMLQYQQVAPFLSPTAVLVYYQWRGIQALKGARTRPHQVKVRIRGRQTKESRRAGEQERYMLIDESICFDINRSSQLNVSM